MNTPYEIHPIAECLPHMSEEEFAKLLESVKAEGVLIPIVIYEGKVLDGRHRYLASIEAGCVCPVNYYTGKDPFGHVIALNDLRRHLTASQRAIVAGKMAKLGHGGDRKSEDWNQEAKLPLARPTVSEAAEMLDVSPRSVKDARVVLGDEKATEAVESGKQSVSSAAAEVRERKKAEAPVETGSLELVELHRKFRSLFGNATTAALADGTLANLKAEKDLTFFLSLPEAKIRAIEELVIGQRWCPRKALKAIERTIDSGDRIQELIHRCIAAKGRFETTINTFRISVTHEAKS